MNPISEKEFQLKYKIGKSAFEQGRYRLSIENLQQAYELVSPHSRRGNEVKMWLINAYQAVGDEEKAIALCRDLISNSYGETRTQAQRLLYIMQAPKLKRPKEWMTQIPDLNLSTENSLKYKPINTKKQQPKPKRQIELVDLSQVNNQDNNFILITLLLSSLTVIGLFFSNF